MRRVVITGLGLLSPLGCGVEVSWQRLTVGQIAEVATLSRPAVSHHLKILRQAGVLDAQREGREVYLRINREVLEETLATVLDYVRTEG